MDYRACPDRVDDALFDVPASVLRDQVDICLNYNQQPVQMGNKSYPAKSSLQQKVSSASDDQLRKASIPTKYWPFLRNMSKYVQERTSAAHDSAEEFAMLLLSLKRTHPDIYYKWADAFPLAFDGTVEELAKRGEDINKDFGF